MSSTLPATPSNKQWAHSLFQDPAMLSPSPPIKPPATTTSVSRHSTAPFQGCDGETGSQKKLSVSRLAFPFNARRKVPPPGPPSPPSPIPKRAPIEPPVRQKHVCLPSPLGRAASANDAPSETRPATPASRLKPRPRYHGYSRHSFMLTKCVWSTRQEQHEARTGSDEAQPETPSGSAFLPKAPSTSHPSFHRLRRLRSFYKEEKKPEQAPLTMFPRQGDIAALRDPYCARVDRCFAAVSLHTLRKLICLFALLIPRQEAFEEAGSEVSFGSGVESDSSTLVDSDTDSEWDASTTCSSRQECGDDVIAASDPSQLSKSNLLSLAVRRVHRELGDVSSVHMSNPAWLARLYRKPMFGTLPREQQVWPANCHGVWELLIELSRRDVEVARLVPKKEAVKPKPPKEFRWLKLLGGPKGGAAGAATKKPTAVASTYTPSVDVKTASSYSRSPPERSPGVRSTFLTPSHPAAG